MRPGHRPGVHHSQRCFVGGGGPPSRQNSDLTGVVWSARPTSALITPRKASWPHHVQPRFLLPAFCHPYLLQGWAQNDFSVTDEGKGSIRGAPTAGRPREQGARTEGPIVCAPRLDHSLQVPALEET